MICRYDLQSGILLLDEDLLMPADHDIEEIGVCTKCTGQLKSLSGHFRKGKASDPDEQIIVSACTVCSTVFVNMYDSDWSWIRDAEPELTDLVFSPDSDQKDQSGKIFLIPVYSEIINTAEELNQIPKEQLLTIFSKTEIEALLQRAGNEKYVRQYYHRAKKKYQKFEDIFGIKLNI